MHLLAFAKNIADSIEAQSAHAKVPVTAGSHSLNNEETNFHERQGR
jgi:hypothetical protein